MRTVQSASSSTTTTTTQNSSSKPWIRGVNIGGWLLLERFITPYFFALTSCHIGGNFCWYPGQIDAPPTDHSDYEICDLYNCKPHLIDSFSHPGQQDYPFDEWTLAQSFTDRNIARRYWEYHWEYFVTRDDLEAAKKAGVTHVRVPLPHWIMGDIQDNEPYIVGGWLYFVRLVNWCRELELQVWPDIHTAPGSQNGFDNNGHLLQGGETCHGWTKSEKNVQRSLTAVKSISEAIVRDGLQDVVTGFGILNEPFVDCDVPTVRDFNNQASNIVKEVLGKKTAIYIGDMFNATKWNDGWWLNPEEYSNTFLDSHYYHVFAEQPRSLSPKQHIAYVCSKNARDTESCCYDDHGGNDDDDKVVAGKTNQHPSQGISRVIGEWSAAFDTLPAEKLWNIMQGIRQDGQAPEMDRILPGNRQDFLKHFVQAQMVTYEAASKGVSRGWFYWTLKMEGGAFAEWDFLRGVKEGWIPTIPDPTTSSESLYGTCGDIADRTTDDTSIIHEFPSAKDALPEKNNWQAVSIDDDYVLSPAGSLANDKGTSSTSSSSSTSTTTTSTSSAKPTKENTGTTGGGTENSQIKTRNGFFPMFFIGFFCFAVYRVFFQQSHSMYPLPYRSQYTQVDSGGPRSILTV